MITHGYGGEFKPFPLLYNYLLFEGGASHMFLHLGGYRMFCSLSASKTIFFNVTGAPGLVPVLCSYLVFRDGPRTTRSLEELPGVEHPAEVNSS